VNIAVHWKGQEQLPNHDVSTVSKDDTAISGFAYDDGGGQDKCHRKEVEEEEHIVRGGESFEGFSVRVADPMT
jgi:hypothetical protein